jgi:hypothetical protein
MRNDLDAIQARADAADAGPWFVTPIEGDFGCDTYPDGVGRRADCPRDRWHNHVRVVLTPNPNFPWTANLAFAAAARQDVPALVAEVRELREVRDDLVIAACAVIYPPSPHPGDSYLEGRSLLVGAVARAQDQQQRESQPEPVDPLKARP